MVSLSRRLSILGGVALVAALGLAVAIPAHAATEDTAPTAVITGDNTGLGYTYGVALDAANNIYATNAAGNSVSVFAAGSSGDATPLRTIAGDLTGLDYPAGIAVSSSGEIYVANNGSSTISVFSATAEGDVAPVRVIGNSDSTLNRVWALDLDANGSLVVGELTGHILVFPAGAGDNTAPSRDISAADVSAVYGVAIDTDGTIYASSIYTSSLVAFDASANGESIPIRTIAGGNTELYGPIGVDVTGGVITVSQYFGTSVATFNTSDNGDVAPIRYIVGATTTLRFPIGIAVDPQGSIYVGNENASIAIFAALAPTISSVSPSIGSSAGGTVVTITGTNFASGTNVTIGGVVATGVVVTSPTLLTAVVPAHAVGAVDVTVSTSGGAASLAAAFTYTPVAATAALAATGAEFTGPASLAGGLLVLGAFVLLARRRRAA